MVHNTREVIRMDSKLANIDEDALQLISQAEAKIEQQTGQKVALIAYDMKN